MNPDPYEWLIVGLILLAIGSVCGLLALLMSRWGSRQSRAEFAHDDARKAIREAMEGTL